MRVFHFGCSNHESGHYLHSPEIPRDLEERRALSNITRTNPWGRQIDGGLCPKNTQMEGYALIHRKDGWTALAFWDRSVDSRPGSNSVFLADVDCDFAELLRVAYENFPDIVARFRFPITEAKP